MSGRTTDILDKCRTKLEQAREAERKAIDILDECRTKLEQAREAERKAIHDYSAIIVAIRADQDALAAALRQYLNAQPQCECNDFSGGSMANALSSIENARDGG